MTDKYSKTNRNEFESIRAEKKSKSEEYNLQRLPKDLLEAISGIKLLATVDTNNVFEKFVSLIGLSFDFIKPCGSMIVKENLISDEVYNSVEKIEKILEDIEQKELDKIIEKCDKKYKEKIIVAFKKLRLLVFHTLLYSTYTMCTKKEGYFVNSGQTISYNRSNSYAGEPSFTVKNNTEWVDSSSTEEIKGRMFRFSNEYEYYIYAEQKIYNEIINIDKNYYGDTSKKPGTNKISKDKIKWNSRDKVVYNDVFSLVSNTYSYCSTDYEELKKYIKIGFNVDYQIPKYSGDITKGNSNRETRKKVCAYTGKTSIFTFLYTVSIEIVLRLIPLWIVFSLMGKMGLWIWNLFAHGSTPFFLTFTGIIGITLAMIFVVVLLGLLSSIWVLKRASKKLTLVDFN